VVVVKLIFKKRSDLTEGDKEVDSAASNDQDDDDNDDDEDDDDEATENGFFIILMYVSMYVCVHMYVCVCVLYFMWADQRVYCSIAAIL